VSGIPSIALDIPDFEGSARLQVFANSTKTQIGCFQAVMRNGNSFSHPDAIASILGVFTAVAIVSSFLTAIYGISITHMRTHYAHSFSVLVIFETFQSIFFSGALSMEWPSVLPAWWSNFAWSAGMIHIEKMIDAIDPFAGVSGNASQVGGAGSAVISTGGGIIQQIYGRSLTRRAPKQILRRAHAAYNASDPYDYTWAGNPVTPGMPTPGTWRGFAGDLASVNIPVADAFLVGLIWLAIALALVALSIAVLKFSMDLFARMKWMKEDRFAYFRGHLPGYLGVAVLRTLFASFFAIITLALFQFSLRGPIGPTVIAAVVLAVVLVVVGGVVAYACHSRLRDGKFQTGPDTILFERGKLLKTVPFVSTTRVSKIGEKESTVKPLGSMPFFKVQFIDDDPARATVHRDEAYIKRFGWLSARYRQTRWWFFAFWLGYQLIRACFIGGAARSPLAQVFGLFAVEIIAFFALIKLNPFEGQRNTALAIWMLSIGKIVTAGCSIAFLPAFKLGRIMSAVFGIIIIVVQGFVVVAVMILVVLGAISTWMSLSRNREDFPDKWDGLRIKYFEHIQVKAKDQRTEPKPKKKKKPAEPEPPKEPYFAVTSVRRRPKIEDEDVDETVIAEVDEEEPAGDPAASASVGAFPSVANRPSRTNSLSSRMSVGSLPRAARPHRASWSSKDFAAWEAQVEQRERERPESALSHHRVLTPHSRSNSLRIAALRSQGSLPQLREGSPTGEFESPRRPMTPTREISEEVVSKVAVVASDKSVGKDVHEDVGNDFEKERDSSGETTRKRSDEKTTSSTTLNEAQ
jgi:hypothetical protein